MTSYPDHDREETIYQDRICIQNVMEVLVDVYHSDRVELYYIMLYNRLRKIW